jgi:uncharacterized protein YwgA
MQSYQQVTLEIMEEIPNLGKKDPQKFFWSIKKEQPERFERLRFDTNGYEPYSDVLSDIMFDLYMAGLYVRPSRYEK